MMILTEDETRTLLVERLFHLAYLIKNGVDGSATVLAAAHITDREDVHEGLDRLRALAAYLPARAKSKVA